MFTQRAVLLGVVSFCFYLVAVVNSLSGFYYALTWLSVAMLAASLGVALLALSGLECRLELTRSRGAAALGESEMGESGSALVAMSISNSGMLSKTNVLVEMRLLDTKNEVHSLSFLLEALPSGAAIESVLPLTRLQRGKYQLHETRLIGSDVLGLFRRQKIVALDAQSAREIIIGPPVLKSEIALQSGSNGFLLGRQRASLTRHGDEVRGTRPYVPGDDLRHVHWKSSARAGELVVKEWEQTGQSGALVIWDGAAQTAWGEGDFEAGEWGLILSASLCHAFLGNGIPCDFARLDDAPALVEARALAGGELPAELTDVLSGAAANRTISLEAAMHRLPRLLSRAGLQPIVVSASLSGDLVKGVSALRARGARVQVILIDAASLAARADDPRFRTRGAKFGVFKAPFQSDGDQTIPISSANYQLQIARLREAGARVVGVSASDGESAADTLRAALRAAAQTTASGKRNS